MQRPPSSTTLSDGIHILALDQAGDRLDDQMILLAAHPASAKALQAAFIYRGPEHFCLFVSFDANPVTLATPRWARRNRRLLPARYRPYLRSIGPDGGQPWRHLQMAKCPDLQLGYGTSW